LPSRGEVCAATVISKIHNESLVAGLRAELARNARKVEIRELGTFQNSYELREAVEDCEALALLVGSGGTERIITTGLKGYPGGVLLVSYPGNNSLAAAVEAAAALRELGVNASLHHYKDGKRLVNALMALRAVSLFRRSRIGLFGEPEPWLVYSRVDPGEVEKLGPQVIRIPLERLYEAYHSISDEDAVEIARGYRVRASSKIKLEELVKVAKLYLAIDSIVSKDRLDAYTIQCFEVIRALHLTPCFSLALHNSKGIVAGCEGDLSSLVAMMLSYYSSGTPAFMGNIVDVNGSKALFAHCTAPIKIGNYRITTHFETGYPAGISVSYPAGRPVTIVKTLVGKRRMIVARATVKASTPRPNTCRTQIVAELEGGADWLLRGDLGNHYVLVLGDHADTLSTVGELLGFTVEVH